MFRFISKVVKTDLVADLARETPFKLFYQQFQTSEEKNRPEADEWRRAARGEENRGRRRLCVGSVLVLN